MTINHQYDYINIINHYQSSLNMVYSHQSCHENLRDTTPRFHGSTATPCGSRRRRAGCGAAPRPGKTAGVDEWVFKDIPYG